jgi:hypothetical protein
MAKVAANGLNGVPTRYTTYSRAAEYLPTTRFTISYVLLQAKNDAAIPGNKAQVAKPGYVAFTKHEFNNRSADHYTYKTGIGRVTLMITITRARLPDYAAIITCCNLGLAFGMVLLIAAISSWLAIRRVLKIQPFDIFRGRGSDTSRRGREQGAHPWAARRSGAMDTSDEEVAAPQEGSGCGPLHGNAQAARERGVNRSCIANDSRRSMKTDIDIQQDVLAKLPWEPAVNAARIGVEAEQCVVTLTGRVDTFAEKCAAERVAQRVAGCRRWRSRCWSCFEDPKSEVTRISRARPRTRRYR